MSLYQIAVLFLFNKSVVLIVKKIQEVKSTEKCNYKSRKISLNIIYQSAEKILLEIPIQTFYKLKSLKAIKYDSISNKHWNQLTKGNSQQWIRRLIIQIIHLEFKFVLFQLWKIIDIYRRCYWSQKWSTTSRLFVFHQKFQQFK